ncbi:MAG: type II secretion system F family protein [Shewanella sp.]|nr:type II secretion system F family protein [Shewanella sp.]MCF1430165.1 type II secretion system F family protein [Shewanella sp.]MCF1437572.1 type II secretion system F family protein [Shewanella sp.]MCF1456243.1 type II secretion system F family protein [Shewanella sp.]
MSMQVTLFLVLLLLVCGIAAILYLAYTSLRRRHRLHHYLSEETVSDERDAEPDNVLGSLVSQFSPTEEEINRKFVEAGMEEFQYTRYYMHFKYGMFIVGAALMYLWSQTADIASDKLLIAGILWFVFCLIAPDSYLAQRKKSLIRNTSSQLPYLLDLLAICVQTGMTLEAAISYLALEMRGFDKNLAKLLARVNERSRVVGLERALDELYLRIPSPEMRSFVMTLKQSLQYGSSIYLTLTTLAADIRAVNMLQVEEKIGKLAAKMSIPLILFIMFPIVIIIVAPGIMRLSLNV